MVRGSSKDTSPEQQRIQAGLVNLSLLSLCAEQSRVGQQVIAELLAAPTPWEAGAGSPHPPHQLIVLDLR